MNENRPGFDLEATVCFGKPTAAVADMAERLPYRSFSSQQEVSNLLIGPSVLNKPDALLQLCKTRVRSQRIQHRIDV